MSDTANQQFKIQINFTKAYKSADGGHYVEGIASGPEVDLTGERMTLSALQSMVEFLKKRIVEFRSEHSDHWNAELELAPIGAGRSFRRACTAPSHGSFGSAVRSGA